ncbi:MAG: hypothetical protein IPJ43_03060 [Saprospiraceae bacterium]|nr:hypothetical protein [Saprospiraceae bacterium]
MKINFLYTFDTIFVETQTMHAKAKNQAPVKIDTFKVTSSNYWYFPVILGFAILILYGQTTSFDYCGDDVLVTTGNQYVKQGFGGIKKYSAIATCMAIQQKQTHSTVQCHY